MAALIGGTSISKLSNIAKKRVLSVFLILITVAFFVFILNTDDNLYFEKSSNPFIRALFKTDSLYKTKEFMEVFQRIKTLQLNIGS
jgi:hypothetical protein